VTGAEFSCLKENVLFCENIIQFMNGHSNFWEEIKLGTKELVDTMKQ
jgi:hypothetical protein